MKNLLFSLIAIVLLSFSGNAQSKYVLDLKKYLPEELIMGSKDTYKFVTGKEYSEKLNGTIYFEGYFENDVVKYKTATISFDDEESLIAAEKAISGCPKGYRACARGCNDSPTTLGLGLCVIYCVIDCSGN